MIIQSAKRQVSHGQLLLWAKGLIKNQQHWAMFYPGVIYSFNESYIWRKNVLIALCTVYTICSL